MSTAAGGLFLHQRVEHRLPFGRLSGLGLRPLLTRQGGFACLSRSTDQNDRRIRQRIQHPGLNASWIHGRSAVGIAHGKTFRLIGNEL